MSDQGEAVDKRGPTSPAKTERRKVTVRVSLFYDGTGNNRVNVRHREANDWTYWWMRKAVPGTTSSFDDDVSNVVRLAENLEGSVTGYTAYIHVYTEGIGTSDGFTDSRPGMGAGLGTTAIQVKVGKGLDAAIQSLQQLYKPSDTVLDRVSIDTSGFSRGAAAARNCVHVVLNGTYGTKPMKVRLERMGYEVGAVDVLAVGLFDTVSSQGYTLGSYDDNVTTLHLTAIQRAAAVYQLAAAEEYRERFSLTSIDSASGKGRQVYLPGAHSDVGGGYRDGAGEESRTLFEGPGAHEIFEFMKARGWFQTDARGPEMQYYVEQEGEYNPYGGRSPGTPETVTARRTAVGRAYTFIPLGLMGKWLREHGVPVRSRLERLFNPGAVPGRKAIEAYAQLHTSGGDKSKPTDWDESADADLKTLRHGFLHVPFCTDIGMSVRLTPKRRPTRKVYPG